VITVATSGSGYSPPDHRTKQLSDYQTNFTLRLGGPFGAIVSGRTFTNRLLSVLSSGAYSSSSQPFGYFHRLYPEYAGSQDHRLYPAIFILKNSALLLARAPAPTAGAVLPNPKPFLLDLAIHQSYKEE
jgi:hypothetical protein